MKASVAELLMIRQFEFEMRRGSPQCHFEKRMALNIGRWSATAFRAPGRVAAFANCIAHTTPNKVTVGPETLHLPVRSKVLQHDSLLISNIGVKRRGGSAAVGSRPGSSLKGQSGRMSLLAPSQWSSLKLLLRAPGVG